MKAPGIYDRGAYLRVVACIGRGTHLRKERRFPAGTSLREMKRWQQDTCAALRIDHPEREPGSLLEDLESRYLPAIAAMPTLRIRERHLRMWATALGARRARSTVKPPEIRAVLERWQLAGWSVATCNRARTALMHFYSVLGGKSGANPVRDVAKGREKRRPPKPIDYPTFERILAAMPDTGQRIAGETPKDVSQTKARLRVIAYTGLPHAQIMALVPGQIRWEDRAVYVVGRNKGEGTDDRWLPLSRAGVDALRAFAAANAWGPFSTSAMRISFQRAARAIGRPDLTPYDLRHLFGTTVLACSHSRSATRDLMLHTTDATTARYTAGAISIELRAALDAFDREVVAARCGVAVVNHAESA